MSQQEYGFIVRKIKFGDFTVLFRSKCLSVGSANRGDSARASSLAASYLGRFREPVGHKSVGKVANIFGTTSLEAEDVQVKRLHFHHPLNSKVNLDYSSTILAPVLLQHRPLVDSGNP